MVGTRAVVTHDRYLHDSCHGNAASVAASYPLGFIHLDLDENSLIMKSGAPK